jgi:hypothetical protein
MNVVLSSWAHVKTTSAERSHLPTTWWCKPLPIITRIRFGMTEAVFPDLHRYRRKGLTDTRANIVLTTQAQRDSFLFHSTLYGVMTRVCPITCHTNSPFYTYLRYSASSSGSSSTGVGITFVSFSSTFCASSRKIAASFDWGACSTTALPSSSQA